MDRRIAILDNGHLEPIELGNNMPTINFPELFAHLQFDRNSILPGKAVNAALEYFDVSSQASAVQCVLELMVDEVDQKYPDLRFMDKFQAWEHAISTPQNGQNVVRLYEEKLSELWEAKMPPPEVLDTYKIGVDAKNCQFIESQAVRNYHSPGVYLARLPGDRVAMSIKAYTGLRTETGSLSKKRRNLMAVVTLSADDTRKLYDAFIDTIVRRAREKERASEGKRGPRA